MIRTLFEAAITGLVRYAPELSGKEPMLHWATDDDAHSFLVVLAMLQSDLFDIGLKGSALAYLRLLRRLDPNDILGAADDIRNRGRR